MTPLAAASERGPWARFGAGIRHNKMASFGAGIVVLMVLSAVLAPWLSPHDPLEQDVMLRLAQPTAGYPLGNDSFGRDILSRILWGGRVSLYVSTLSVLIAIVIGGALGILAGYIGGLFDRVVMAGKIEKTVLFQPYRILRLLPDWRTIHMWYSYATRDRKDDTLLLAVIREFERDNIHFDSALDYCPELLVKHGFLTRRKPTDAQWRDIRFGWDLAKEMGRLDIGQSVVINDMAVIAVEAIEGTDQCIRRAGELCRRGFTVVKVAKPQQDMRFDVPTIGLKTIQTMHESGGRVLAIESGMTIFLDQQEVIDLADKLGIAVVAVKAEEMALRLVG